LDRKIRVGAVSYLNTKPLIYGLEQGMMEETVQLTIDYPSNIAAALLNNEIDIGLVPVAIIPEMKAYEIISDYCISSDGEVGSVCLFSEVPVNEIKKVLLDYQSRTSVELVQLLLKEYWNLYPVFEKAGADFREKIAGDVAAVVIGDRAFEQKKISTYTYDLGLAWKNLTGLPFVFAAWISNKPIDEGFIKDFNNANEFGLKHIDAVVAQNPYQLFDLKKYYTRYIQYRLNAESRKGMAQFLESVRQSTIEIPLYK
jgi:chorismate dehydratase